MKNIWKAFILIIITLVVVYSSINLLPSLIGENLIDHNDTVDFPIGTSVGELAPDFTATSIDGDMINLSNHRGKVVLINNFATWCGPCLAETPHLVDVFKTNVDELFVIGLNLQEDSSSVITYKSDFQVPYPLILDEDGSITEIYKPIGLPTSWFIDPTGVVRYIHAGPMTASMIELVITEVFLGRQPDLSLFSGVFD